MKAQKIAAIFLLFVIGCISSVHGNRMDRIRWTDRGLSNPPMSKESSIDSTIEQFWNVKLQEEPLRTTRSTPSVTLPSCASQRSSHSVEVKQDRKTRERRGYFGINLFNAIPIIDFVHGSVTTDSSDNVAGRR